ncbi:unnamed protein product, partial [Staurois parvus]
CTGHTLYYQKYWDTPPNHWIQLFQPPRWPQVYKMKHLGMQTASTNICERMGHSQELSEFKRGAMIGCHLCNKSIRDTSLILNFPRTTVSAIRTKWKQLGTTATQPPSDRPLKMTEQGQRMLKCTVCGGSQLSAESIAKDLQTSCGLHISTTTELHGMCFYGRAAASKPYITKCNAKHQMQRCKVSCHWSRKQYLPDCIVPSVKF